MLRYSFRSKDLEKLEKHLLNMGYNVERRVNRSLSDMGDVILKEYLRVEGEEVYCHLYSTEAHAGFSDHSNRKDVLGEKDKRLINFIRKEYKFPIPRDDMIFSGILIVTIGTFVYLLL